MKKILSYLCVVFVIILTSLTTVNAKSYIKDLFQAGDEVKIDKELDGTSFIAGNRVEINKKIKGIGFIAGNEIEINEEQDYLFAFASDIKINDIIEKDLFVFSPTINISSNIKRDAYLAGELINLDGSIERNVYIYGTEVNLKGTYNGNVTIYATEINIDENIKITGTLKYNSDAVIEGLKDNIKTKTYIANETNISLKDYITNFINSYIHITILAIVLIFITEKTFKKSLDQTKQINVKTISTLFGKGLLILIGVPIIVMMLLFSGLFVSVGIIGGLIYGISVYISNIFTAYFIAHALDKKIINKNMNSYMLVIFGLLIINILQIVPIIGGLLSIITTSIGLGIIGNMLIEHKNN